MARNRSTNRRRRRGRFSFLMKLLCSLLIAGAVVAALTIFFKVQSVTVSGNALHERGDHRGLGHRDRG